MVWNVYNCHFNDKEIEVFNIFNHTRFSKEVEELRRQPLSAEEFSEELRHIAMYYFWSKCEYEIILTSWPPYMTNENLDKLIKEHEECPHFKYSPNLETAKKIDIFNQLQLNWDAFVSYVRSAED